MGATLTGLQVLVVENDALIREMLTRMLEALGHQVRSSDTVAGARKLARSRCDLVVTDLHLLDGDGQKLAIELRSASPEIAVVIASGSPAPPEVAEMRIIWLQKPFRQKDLEAALQQAWQLRPGSQGLKAPN